MNVAVDPATAAAGVASALIDELFAQADGERTPLHARGARLQRRRDRACTSEFGFRAAGVRPRYYHDNGEDALIMWRSPTASSCRRTPSNPTEWKGHR